MVEKKGNKSRGNNGSDGDGDRKAVEGKRKKTGVRGERKVVRERRGGGRGRQRTREKRNCMLRYRNDGKR